MENKNGEVLNMQRVQNSCKWVQNQLFYFLYESIFLNLYFKIMKLIAIVCLFLNLNYLSTSNIENT